MLVGPNYMQALAPDLCIIHKREFPSVFTCLLPTAAFHTFIKCTMLLLSKFHTEIQCWVRGKVGEDLLVSNSCV